MATKLLILFCLSATIVVFVWRQISRRMSRAQAAESEDNLLLFLDPWWTQPVNLTTKEEDADARTKMNG